MLAILGITFPIYVIIALGYVCVRKGVFRPGICRNSAAT